MAGTILFLTVGHFAVTVIDGGDLNTRCRTSCRDGVIACYTGALCTTWYVGGKTYTIAAATLAFDAFAGGNGPLVTVGGGRFSGGCLWSFSLIRLSCCLGGAFTLRVRNNPWRCPKTTDATVLQIAKGIPPVFGI
jgi:hypothetical protein